MKFILKEEKNKKPVFGDVAENQFFVSNQGYLCQKFNYSSIHQKVGYYNYNVIADEKGMPLSMTFNDVSCNTIISRILPEVEKIEF